MKVEPRPTQVYAIDVRMKMRTAVSSCKSAADGARTSEPCATISAKRWERKRTWACFCARRPGMFTLDEAHTIEEIDAAEDLTPLLVAMDKPLGQLPRLDVQPKAERFVRNGNKLTRRELIGDIQPGKPTRLYLNGQFCGIGRFEGENLKFDAMLLE